MVEQNTYTYTYLSARDTTRGGGMGHTSQLGLVALPIATQHNIRNTTMNPLAQQHSATIAILYLYIQEHTQHNNASTLHSN